MNGDVKKNLHGLTGRPEKLTMSEKELIEEYLVNNPTLKLKELYIASD